MEERERWSRGREGEREKREGGGEEQLQLYRLYGRNSNFQSGTIHTCSDEMQSQW